MTHKLPETASVAVPIDDGKLFAPSADRNADALCKMLDLHAPTKGRALEIASGTGQHVARFATVRPGLYWQPTDLDPARLASIDAYASAVTQPNIAPAMRLDATVPGWPREFGQHDLIILVNLLHLISAHEAQTVVAEGLQALTSEGKFMIYGPFLRNGRATSEGDANFDASLRAQDADIGYKDVATVQGWMAECRFTSTAYDMPANNLMLIAQR